MNSRKQVWLIVAALLVAALPVALLGAQDQESEQFNALAVHIGTGPSGQVPVIIGIDRWTTDDEAQVLLQAVQNNDHDALKKALDDQDETGYIRFPTVRSRFPSTRLHFARQFEKDGQRVVVLATNRPLAVWEVWNQPRTADYDLTLIELRVDDQGNGEGALAMGVEIGFDADKQQLAVKNWSSSPVQLKEVKKHQ